MKVSISLLLLAFLFRRIDVRAALSHMRNVECPHFCYAIVLFLIVTWLGILRWTILLKIVKRDLSCARIFTTYCGGLFFNVFLPSSIGGDIVRTVDLAVHTKDTSAILATVLLDRIFGFIGLAVVALIGFLYGSSRGMINDPHIMMWIVAMIVFLLCGLLVTFSRRVFNLLNKLIPVPFVKEFLHKFHSSFYTFRSEKKALARVFVLSVVLQACFSGVLYYIGLSIGISAGIVYYLVFIPLVTILSMLPISIGGLGVRENAAVILFSAVGVQADKVAAMSLLGFAFLFFAGLVGGSIYGIALYCRRLQRHTQDAVPGSG